MPRSEEANREIRENRREEILRSSLKVFASRGLKGAKISDISKESCISQGLIYHYYKSKEEIYTELIKKAFRKLNSACEELNTLNLEPLEKIRVAVNGLLDALRNSETNALNYLLIAQATISEDIPKEAKEIIEQSHRFPYEIFEDIFRKGQKDGSIRGGQVSDYALLFWTTIKGIAMHKAAHGEGFRFPDTEIIMNMFRKQR